MATTPASVTLEVEHGPVLRAGLDVLDLAIEMGHLLPKDQREELMARAQTLAELMKSSLGVKA